MTALPLVTRSRPLQLVVGDAQASRGLVLPGDSSTQLSPMTGTTALRSNKSHGVGRPAIGAKRLPTGRMARTMALLLVSTSCRTPQGCGELPLSRHCLIICEALIQCTFGRSLRSLSQNSRMITSDASSAWVTPVAAISAALPFHRPRLFLIH